MIKHISFASAAVGMILIAGVAFAQEDTITFPIPELGGCTSKEACHTYCEDPANTQACITFAEKNNLMSTEEAKMARKIGNEKGPGDVSDCSARRTATTRRISMSALLLPKRTGFSRRKRWPSQKRCARKAAREDAKARENAAPTATGTGTSRNA